MDSTTMVTGTLLFILIVTAILTLFLSSILLWQYRRSTMRGMARVADTRAAPHGEITVIDKSAAPVSRNRAKLKFLEITKRQTHARQSQAVGQGASNLENLSTVGDIHHLERHTTIVYLAGGLAYALTMTIAMLLASKTDPAIGLVLLLSTIYLWPTVIALNLVTAIGRREGLMLLGTYALLLAAVIIIVLRRNPETTFLAPFFLWAGYNIPPTVFFLFFLRSRVRSVGPVVFTFILCGVSGAVLSIQLLDISDVSLWTLVSVGEFAGLGAGSLFVLIQLVGFGLFALAGRYLLRRLGAAYRNKLCSDRSIAMDSMWILFAVVQSIGFAFEGLQFVWAAPVAFLAYRCVVSAGFRRLRSQERHSHVPPQLLLLRVFSLGRRSNRFFEKFSRLWRQTGVINMIAGPDLVTAEVEPHEFLEFAAGKHARRFVTGADDLNRRMQARDLLPDPDGRYRVHEFFCHDDTWKMTMQALAENSEAILMDLRSFSSVNQGCLYELEVLLDTVDLRRMVFIVDKTTDSDFLKQSFLALWQKLSIHSPNKNQAEPTISLFTAEYFDRQVLKLLITLLLKPIQNDDLEVYPGRVRSVPSLDT